MKAPINLDQHNIIDYAFVATGLTAPAALNFPAEAVKSIAAVSMLSFSKDLNTRYRYSLRKKIPIGVHMVGDLVVGGAIAAAPFALGYAKKMKPWQLALQVAFGLSAFAVVGMTHPRSEAGREREKEIPGELEHVRSLAA